MDTRELEKRIAKLEQDVASLRSVRDIEFIEEIKRRLRDAGFAYSLALNDLIDVDTTGVANGEVIKYNSSNQTWENAVDIDT